jgi:hypothetical protein
MLQKRKITKNKYERRKIFKDMESQTDVQKFNQCSRKDVYETKRVADKFVQGQLEEYGVVLRSYECPFCKKWHLTKKVQ